MAINEDKLKHMLGVARKCYELSKARNWSERKCREMFVLGLLHDVGYEFAEGQQDWLDHAGIGAEILSEMGFMYSEEVRLHGFVVDDSSEELNILNMADLLVNSKGEFVTVQKRIDDVAGRHPDGQESRKHCGAIARRVGLFG